jgi:type II secretory pathway pseudopilin PulG
MAIRKRNTGFSLVEIGVAVGISTILFLVVGVLLVGGQRSWNKTYESAYGQDRQAGEIAVSAFTSVGRKANCESYKIYNKSGGTFVEVAKLTSAAEEVVSGNAAELRYWDVDIDEGDTYNLMDTAKDSTAYAFFYLEDGVLYADYYSDRDGTKPPQAVTAGARRTSGVTTVTLAENVTKDPNIGIFSHTVKGSIGSKKGQGCVRLTMLVGEPNSTKQNKVMSAIWLRNKWPR